MTKQSLRSISAWVFILAVVFILTALFVFHWAAGVFGVGVGLWQLSAVIWSHSYTKRAGDEN